MSSFPCPHCSTVLEPGTPACPDCGIRLTGPQAARLWYVNQQIVTLRQEASTLVQELLQPSSVPAALPALPVAGGQDRPRATRGPSGQQLLLGLGAVMLLSASSFFLWVVWVVVGIVGQALIMAALTGLAVAGSVVATRRGLHAAAETGAVLATGLLLIDLSAAHSLGLGGLDRFAADRYWLGASVLAGVLLLGWDRLVPRERDGRALRAVLTYRPAAAAMLALPPWLVLSVVEPQGAAAVGSLGVTALVGATCAAAALRFDRSRSVVPVHHVPASAVVLAVSTTLATLGFLALGLATAYDGAGSVAQRYAAWAMLALVPAAVAVLTTRIGTRVGRRVAEARPQLPYLAVGLALPLVPVPLGDLPYGVLVAVAVAVAAFVVAHHLGRVAGRTPVGRAWTTALAYAAHLAQPALVLAAWVGAVDAPVLLVAVPAVAWAGSTLVGVWRHRAAGWVPVAQTATAAALLIVLETAGERAWTSVALAVFAAQVVIGGDAVRRATRPGGEPVFWRVVDLSALGFGAAYAATAVAASLGTSVQTTATVLVSIGVLTLGYAGAPGRLAFAYLGSLTVSAGTGLFLLEADVAVVEAYTAPLVVLLTAIGLVHWRRDRGAATVLTMGPALSAAFGPTLLVAVGGGDALRLAAVSAVAAGTLLVGLTFKWKAPVATSAVVLLVIAVTQGGPLIAYVPGWITLGATGAALLAAGVAWERAVLAGRRANAWFATLS
ncbi:SCO7613 C-terminal domain-containing membrane protein [Nocardioides sp. SYSU DS0663]|uniref:SCO7613 C-terminal domain-containing membrane protein n=1 Tax=Nocardioides sp. SYSU DS0663 TaxID=3416445 RepID=UPI003F4C842D